jgi:TRAP-type C4-dicarboxylate transport system permease small subunit
MHQLQKIYLDIFKVVYPFLDTHFVSYLLFLSIIIGITYITWKIIQKRARKSAIIDKIMMLAWYGLLLFLIGYIAWFIMIHFETYQLFNKK